MDKRQLVQYVKTLRKQLDEDTIIDLIESIAFDGHTVDEDMKNVLFVLTGHHEPAKNDVW